jgi:hypothetical protein
MVKDDVMNLRQNAVKSYDILASSFSITAFLLLPNYIHTFDNYVA